MSTEMKSNNSANSICIPRAFANITEARVRKIFDALHIFTIDRVDMIQRKNEKGEPFQRIFVHIRTWSETADAQKAKERLLAGKELKIVYDDPWFWKVSLNTWTAKPAPASLYDRKPRIRIDFDEDTANVNAATALFGSLDLGKEDQRPYRERRVDPVYCEQDANQGFRDRRQDTRRQEPYRRSDPRENRRDGERFREDRREDRRRNEEPSRSMSPGRRSRDCRRHRDDEQLLAEASFSQRFQPRSPSRSPPRREETSKNTVLPPAASIAQALPDVKAVEVVKEVVKVNSVKRDQGLVTRMEHAFRCEITDDIYLDNRQTVRDQMEIEQERPLLFNVDNISGVLDYKQEDGTIIAAPKRKARRVVAAEEVQFEDK